MKKLILVVLFSLCFSAESFSSTFSECKDIIDMEDYQIETLQYAFHRGAPYNLGETLAAIAWQEGQAGKFIINYTDPSASTFMILAQTALSYENLKDTQLNRNWILGKLATNRDYAADFAIRILTENKKRFDGNRFNIYAAYNAGPTWYKKKEYVQKRARSYALKVQDKVRTLIWCKDYWKN